VLFHAGSNLVMLPIQDVFAWSDRINVPATVGADNWTYRLPWPVDRLLEIPDACEAAARLRHWAEESGRTVGTRRIAARPPGSEHSAALGAAGEPQAETAHLR
jgi:4-alpha-glucanotransferase